MLMREPKIEYVGINITDVIATSGPSYDVCEKINGSGINRAGFCATMLVEDMSWEDICTFATNAGDTTNMAH